MKKMMFNDRYGLTQAVIEGRKTMTRRGDGINPYLTDVYDNSVDRFNRGHIDCIELIGTKRVWAYKPRYKVGEIVAVAQNYRDAGVPNNAIIWHKGENTFADCTGGWRNKMYVKSELMPHQIRITGVRAERLQDITDEECLREGVYKDECKTYFNGYAFDLTRCEGNCILATQWYKSPIEAFSALIDKISGKGTWERNPWVWVYEFELVK